MARVAQILPVKPWRTRRGRYPQWSRWAWVTRTSEMDEGGTGKSDQFISRRRFSP
nr:hypothetical protein [Actinomyces polynesiensis]